MSIGKVFLSQISRRNPSWIYSHYSTSSGAGEDLYLIGPAVRNLLHQYGLTQPKTIGTGSGPKQNLVKGDVLRIVNERSLVPIKFKETSPIGGGAGMMSPVPIGKSLGTLVDESSLTSINARYNFQDYGTTLPSPFIDIELTNMRKTIAKRLFQSKSTIPHAYSTVNCNLSPIMKLRKEMKGAGLKASVNDFIIKCTSNALGKSPSINVVWEKNQIISKGQIDISVAVATSSGLITPIITNVAQKNVLQISQNVNELANKARAGKLQPHEFMGGTFTISNLGMYGIHHFSGIINPPQCAILAVGGGQVSLSSSSNSSQNLETRINLTLSYDASGIDEEHVAQFLAHLKHELENPTETSIGLYSISGQIEINDLLS